MSSCKHSLRGKIVPFYRLMTVNMTIKCTLQVSWCDWSLVHFFLRREVTWNGAVVHAQTSSFVSLRNILSVATKFPCLNNVRKSYAEFERSRDYLRLWERHAVEHSVESLDIKTAWSLAKISWNLMDRKIRLRTNKRDLHGSHRFSVHTLRNFYHAWTRRYVQHLEVLWSTEFLCDGRH